jgi:RNA polymerase sigma-70 factor (ECF subfamily)
MVRAHHAEVYRSARRIVGDDANALDVTQQVFLRVLEGKVALGEARDRGRLLCWLAARTALAHRRGARTRREQEGTHAMERPNTTGGADDEAQRAEVRDALQRQVALLPEELRTAVVLRFQEQWTFAQIADEQSISEPSAHDRVRRALELLRGRLTQTGFAAVAGDVPGLLLEASRATPADVPAGLEPRLLSLRAPAALAASAKLAAASLALVSVIAVAAAAAWWPESSAGEGAREWAGAVVSPTAPAATAAGIPGGLGTGGRAAVAVETAFPARPGAGAGEGNTLDPDAPGKGVLAGRCVDGDRAPIAGVVVSALSLQHEGKFARFGASAVTGRDGQFALELPVSLETGEEYSLSTRHPDFVRHDHPKAVARLGVTVEVGPFELLSSSHDAAGESSLEVTVLDPAGLPVPHASVSSWRPVTGAGRCSDRGARGPRRDGCFRPGGAGTLPARPEAPERGAAGGRMGTRLPGLRPRQRRPPWAHDSPVAGTHDLGHGDRHRRRGDPRPGRLRGRGGRGRRPLDPGGNRRPRWHVRDSGPGGQELPDRARRRRVVARGTSGRARGHHGPRAAAQARGRPARHRRPPGRAARRGARRAHRGDPGHRGLRCQRGLVGRHGRRGLARRRATGPGLPAPRANGDVRRVRSAQGLPPGRPAARPLRPQRPDGLPRRIRTGVPRALRTGRTRHRLRPGDRGHGPRAGAPACSRIPRVGPWPAASCVRRASVPSPAPATSSATPSCGPPAGAAPSACGTTCAWTKRAASSSPACPPASACASPCTTPTSSSRTAARSNRGAGESLDLGSLALGPRR